MECLQVVGDWTGKLQAIASIRPEVVTDKLDPQPVAINSIVKDEKKQPNGESIGGNKDDPKNCPRPDDMVSNCHIMLMMIACPVKLFQSTSAVLLPEERGREKAALSANEHICHFSLDILGIVYLRS